MARIDLYPSYRHAGSEETLEVFVEFDPFLPEVAIGGLCAAISERASDREDPDGGKLDRYPASQAQITYHDEDGTIMRLRPTMPPMDAGWHEINELGVAAAERIVARLAVLMNPNGNPRRLVVVHDVPVSAVNTSEAQP